MDPSSTSSLIPVISGEGIYKSVPSQVGLPVDESKSQDVVDGRFLIDAQMLGHLRIGKVNVKGNHLAGDLSSFGAGRQENRSSLRSKHLPGPAAMRIEE